jgi:hypothetical protein
MIDCKRVSELAAGAKPTDLPSQARASTTTPPTWEAGCAALLAMARASSDEQVEALRPGFNRAYKVVWVAAWKNKPDSRAGFKRMWKDQSIAMTIERIGLAYSDNPVFSGPSPSTEAESIRRKIDKLLILSAQHAGPIDLSSIT